MILLRAVNGLTAPVRVIEVSSLSFTSNLRTIVHELIGNPVPDITVRPSGPRTGTLTYVLADEKAGRAAELLHRVPGKVDIIEAGVLSMRYIPVGSITLTLDPQARMSWLLTVPFIEVTD